MGLLRKIKTDPFEKRMQEELRARREAAEKDPFGFAAYDHASAERSGYSNYSYWGSTIRVFLKNKVRYDRTRYIRNSKRRMKWQKITYQQKT